ncbi:hypothetical protein [Microcoleus anatoxicus]|uniref:Uncharacterized protein n=1 Tax=Microcoleus anatoxicus PTRS2 TaxID=2705321 RepID=A0ABU8YPG3_9CYAN
MDLTQPYLPQSWVNGQGLNEVVESVKDFFGGVINTATKVWDNFQKYIRGKEIGNIFAPGVKVNFGDWLDADPLGAFAGGLAVGLQWVVEFFVTGAALKGVSAFLKGGGLIMRVGGKITGMLDRVRPIIQLAKGKILQKLGLGQMVRWGVGATQRIWNFDWNQSDMKIRKQQQQLLENLAPQWGEAIGSILGTFCGFSLGRLAQANQHKIIRFNPSIMAKLQELKLNSFDEDSDLWEEAVENLKSAVNASTRVASQLLGLEAFLNIRKIIRGGAKLINLKAIFPNAGKWLESWGEEEREPWSFAKKQEAFVEKFPEGWKRETAEEGIEAFQDACAESLIKVSYAL